MTRAKRSFHAGAWDLARAIILMVLAGPAVGDQLAAWMHHPKPDDLVTDAGNPRFNDSNGRNAAGLPCRSLGITVSRGEERVPHWPMFER